MVQKKGSVSYPDKEYQIHREQYPQRKMLNIKGKNSKTFRRQNKCLFMTLPWGRMSLKRHKKLNKKGRIDKFLLH